MAVPVSSSPTRRYAQLDRPTHIHPFSLSLSSRLGLKTIVRFVRSYTANPPPHSAVHTGLMRFESNSTSTVGPAELREKCTDRRRVVVGGGGVRVHCLDRAGASSRVFDIVIAAWMRERKVV